VDLTPATGPIAAINMPQSQLATFEDVKNVAGVDGAASVHDGAGVDV
jgi:hypothetical protein